MQTHYLTFSKGSAVRTVMFGAVDFDAATRDVQAAREAHGITPISVTARHERYGVRDFIRVLAYGGAFVLLLLAINRTDQPSDVVRPPEFAQAVGTFLAVCLLLAIMSIATYRHRARVRAMQVRSLDEALRTNPYRRRWLAALFWAVIIAFNAKTAAGWFTSAVTLFKEADTDRARGLVVVMVVMWVLAVLAFDRSQRVE